MVKIDLCIDLLKSRAKNIYIKSLRNLTYLAYKLGIIFFEIFFFRFPSVYNPANFA